MWANGRLEKFNAPWIVYQSKSMWLQTNQKRSKGQGCMWKDAWLLSLAWYLLSWLSSLDFKRKVNSKVSSLSRTCQCSDNPLANLISRRIRRQMVKLLLFYVVNTVLDGLPCSTLTYWTHTIFLCNEKLWPTFCVLSLSVFPSNKVVSVGLFITCSIRWLFGFLTPLDFFVVISVCSQINYFGAYIINW